MNCKVKLMTIQSATDVIDRDEFLCCHCRQRIRPGEKCVMFTNSLKMKPTKGLGPGIIMPTKVKKAKVTVDAIETPIEFDYGNIPISRWALVWHEQCYIKSELDHMTKFIMW